MTASERTKRGRFWLPESPDRTVSGSLIADFREIVLDVEDSLVPLRAGESPLSHLMGESLSHPVVLGVVDSDLVTIEMAYGDRSMRLTQGHVQVRERYHAMRVAFGAHLREIVLRELHIEIDALRIWAPPPRIAPEHSGGEGVPARVSVSYTEPPPLSTNSELGEVDVSWPSSWSVGDDFTLTPTTLLTVHLARPLPLREAISVAVAPLRALLALAIGSSCAVTSLSGVPAADVVVAPTVPGGPVSLLYLATGQPPVELPNRYEAPFTLSNVRDRFDDVIARWLHVWHELRTVCDLYFATVFSPAQHPETQFLLTCQAVELIHSLRHEPLRRPKSEHRDLVASLVACLPEEHRDWTQRALIESNRKHLRDQLLELLRETTPGVRAAVGDPEELAGLATRTRHGYTHWTQSEQAARGGVLIGLTDKLRVLAQAFFLRELGFDDAYIDKWLERTRVPERLAHWASAPEIS